MTLATLLWILVAQPGSAQSNTLTVIGAYPTEETCESAATRLKRFLPVRTACVSPAPRTER